jgi:hypothetical protein
VRQPDRKTGISVICSGTTSSPTTIRKSRFRPGNGIQAKANAAKAAIRIGITVAGTVTKRLFRKLWAMLLVVRTRW